jgi:23S rRNA (adenine-N6)-dimethyltransferase
VRADGADLRLPRRPFRVVANPPFGITSALLRRILSSGSRLVRADLVVPAHVARRWTGATAPGVGRWSHTYLAQAAQRLPRDAFRPPSPDGAVVLRVERRHEPSTGDAQVPRGRRRSRGG